MSERNGTNKSRRNPWRRPPGARFALNPGLTERAWELGGQLAELSPAERKVAIERARMLTEPEQPWMPPAETWERMAALAAACEWTLARWADYHEARATADAGAKEKHLAQGLCDALKQLEPRATSVSWHAVSKLIKDGPPGRRRATGYWLAYQISVLGYVQPPWASEEVVRQAVIKKSKQEDALAGGKS